MDNKELCKKIVKIAEGENIIITPKTLEEVGIIMGVLDFVNRRKNFNEQQLNLIYKHISPTFM